ncbi:MAG: hypothetical protein LBI39_02725 [Puniceicoccales bacterium]|jgi:uncharacterized membrane protein|nr:hypothetical protein [Puniceicoccales bacterium]
MDNVTRGQAPITLSITLTENAAGQLRGFPEEDLVTTTVMRSATSVLRKHITEPGTEHESVHAIAIKRLFEREFAISFPYLLTKTREGANICIESVRVDEIDFIPVPQPIVPGKALYTISITLTRNTYEQLMGFPGRNLVEKVIFRGAVSALLKCIAEPGVEHELMHTIALKRIPEVGIAVSSVHLFARNREGINVRIESVSVDAISPAPAPQPIAQQLALQWIMLAPTMRPAPCAMCITLAEKAIGQLRGFPDRNLFAETVLFDVISILKGDIMRSSTSGHGASVETPSVRINALKRLYESELAVSFTYLFARNSEGINVRIENVSVDAISPAPAPQPIAQQLAPQWIILAPIMRRTTCAMRITLTEEAAGQFRGFPDRDLVVETVLFDVVSMLKGDIMRSGTSGHGASVETPSVRINALKRLYESELAVSFTYLFARNREGINVRIENVSVDAISPAPAPQPMDAA